MKIIAKFAAAICRRRVCRTTALLLVLALLPTVGFAQDQRSAVSTAEALHATLMARHSQFANDTPDPVFDFYASRDFAPAWTGQDAARNSAAIVLSTLAHADEQGLRVQDYSATAINWSTPPQAGPEAAAFELSLTADLIRYAANVRLGALDPKQVYEDVEVPNRSLLFGRALNTALSSGNVEDFLASLPPQQPEYWGLIHGLADYRLQRRSGTWPEVEGHADVPLDRNQSLVARLSREDSLLAANPKPSLAEVQRSLARFQARNGIPADGVAGERTLAVLNVPIETRIAQIVANLERWRWVHPSEDRYILVNVPDQMVEYVANNQILLESRAIVGRLGSRTPIVRLEANDLVLNPPWHVPEDIAAAQILPKLRRNPNYLVASNMVLANGPADDPQGRSIDWRKMKAMPYLIEQSPGPNSAMGVMMLDAPNEFGVYLHDTPGRALFQDSKREASNGCIRVEKMLELSALIIGGETTGTTDQLNAEIATGQTQQVALERSIPIYLLYQTAVAYSDGTVGFREDFYGRDKRLTAALAVRQGQ